MSLLSSRLVALMIFSFALCAYLVLGHGHGISGDTVPAKLIPVSILEEGDLDLDEFQQAIYRDHQYSLIKIDDHYYSAYPIFVGLTALPVYAVASILYPEKFASWKDVFSVPEVDVHGHFFRTLEHCSAAIIAALAVVVLWLLLQRLSDNRALNLLLTIGFALGTSNLSTSGWALWQHGPSCLFLGLALLLMHPKRLPIQLALILAGLSAGWAVACRPTNLVVVVFFSVWAVLSYKRQSGYFLVAWGLVVVAAVAINQSIYSHFLGGYSGQSSTLVMFSPAVFLQHLIHPSRGLFVYSPFLLFAMFYVPWLVFRKPLSFQAFCAYASVALIALYACWGFWSGGHSFGPRLLSEAAFLMVIAAAFFPISRQASPLQWKMLIVLVALSCIIHVLGVVGGDHGWNQRFISDNQIKASPVDLRNSQLAWTFIGPP